MKNKLAILLLALSYSMWLAAAPPLKDTLQYVSWEEAQKQDPLSVIAIDFTKQKLDSLPAALSAYSNIQGIRLSKNKLTQLPSFFKDFKALRFVHLNNNKFEVFPYQVFHLPEVVYLDISKNQIEKVPMGIKSLQKLVYLDLWSNSLSSLPEELTELPDLQFVDARGRTYSPSFVEGWLDKLPNVTIKFDKPCKCME